MIDRLQQALVDINYLMTHGKNPLDAPMEMRISVNQETYVRFQSEFNKWIRGQQMIVVGDATLSPDPDKITIQFPYGPKVTIKPFKS